MRKTLIEHILKGYALTSALLLVHRTNSMCNSSLKIDLSSYRRLLLSAGHICEKRQHNAASRVHWVFWCPFAELLKSTLAVSICVWFSQPNQLCPQVRASDLPLSCHLCCLFRIPHLFRHLLASHMRAAALSLSHGTDIPAIQFIDVPSRVAPPVRHQSPFALRVSFCRAAHRLPKQMLAPQQLRHCLGKDLMCASLITLGWTGSAAWNVSAGLKLSLRCAKLSKHDGKASCMDHCYWQQILVYQVNISSWSNSTETGLYKCWRVCEGSSRLCSG